MPKQKKNLKAQTPEPKKRVKGNGKKGLNKNKDVMTRDVARQKIFVKEFLVDFNATRAAKAAGYADKTAENSAYTILSNAGVHHAIEQALEERMTTLEMKAQDVIKALITIYRRSMQEVECRDMFGRPLGIFKFDAKNAIKALELIGKNLMMFPTNVQHSNDPKNPLPASNVIVYLPDNGRTTTVKPVKPEPSGESSPANDPAKA